MIYMNRLIVIQQALRGSGAAIDYSDLGHENTSMNDTSCTLQENLRIDFAYHANHALLLTAK